MNSKNIYIGEEPFCYSPVALVRNPTKLPEAPLPLKVQIACVLQG